MPRRQCLIALQRTQCPPRMEQGKLVSRNVDSRSAYEVTVEVLWITLSLHQAFAASIGATREVRMSRFAAVVGGDDGLSGERREMHSAMAVVDELLRVPDCPTSIERRGGHVAIIGARRGRAAQERLDHAEVRDRTGEPAVSHLFIAMVPPRCGQPELESDIRVRCRFDRPRHATMGREFDGQRRSRRSGHGDREVSSGDGLRLGERRIHEPKGCQSRTFVLRCGVRDVRDRKEAEDAYGGMHGEPCQLRVSFQMPAPRGRKAPPCIQMLSTTASLGRCQTGGLDAGAASA